MNITTMTKNLDRMGAILKQLRKEAGISQAELSEGIELEQGSISRIERAEYEILLKRYVQICCVLGINPGETLNKVLKGEQISILDTKVAQWAAEITPEQVKEKNYHPQTAGRWHPAPEGAGGNTFVFSVNDYSMINANPGQRSYPPGTLVFVDPDKSAKPGNRVLAIPSEGATPTLKEYVEHGGNPGLHSYASGYPLIQCTEKTVICGVIIGAYLPEQP